MSDETTAVDEKPAEFHNDAQRDGYLNALEHERSGYEARIPKAKLGLDPASVEQLEARIQQVDDETSRVLGTEKPKRRNTAADKKAPAAQTEPSATGKDDGGGDPA